MSQKLWEYDNCTLFEVEPFHHCPSQYDSWEAFVNDKQALTCNCIYGSPLLYWYWDNNWSDLDDMEFDICKENFKRVVFI